jgi:DNA invertase Pin-like site-specific DNA recombinase
MRRAKYKKPYVPRKLSALDVERIKELYRQGVKAPTIAIRLALDSATVANVIARTCN